jgi:hypothetical protein
MPKREKPDPVYFGEQPDGTYAPGPIEIAQRCAEIRKDWSVAECIHRERLTPSVSRFRLVLPNDD